MSRHGREPTTREPLGAAAGGVAPHLVPNLLVRQIIEEDIESSRAEHELLVRRVSATREAKKGRPPRRRQRAPRDGRAAGAPRRESSLGEHKWPKLDMAIFEGRPTVAAPGAAASRPDAPSSPSASSP